MTQEIVGPNDYTEHPAPSERDRSFDLQREVAERLLLGALREKDSADLAEASRRSAAFLAGMSLPNFGDWCIVDTLDENDVMHRLSIIHPDPRQHTVIEALVGRWSPAVGDPFGLPAAMRTQDPAIATDDLEAVLATTQGDPPLHDALLDLGIGTLLTVPLTIRQRIVAAITFVSTKRGRRITQQDIDLADDLAHRGAVALDRARLYGEAIALRAAAESASQAKSEFLGMMSHELRTPLNVIGGYLDLLELEVHGSVTPEQRLDLARIRITHRYLTDLMGNLLSLTRLGSGKLEYDIHDFSVVDVLQASVSLVEMLIAKGQLVFDGVACERGVIASGDQEKVIQILVNLLSNAIKFTPAGGRVAVGCEADFDSVRIHVSDTGIGIKADKLEAVFDPFVQVKGTSIGPEGGIGLGLAISRGLARGMNGDLTAESTFGEGSRLTLTLPRRSATAAAMLGASR